MAVGDLNAYGTLFKCGNGCNAELRGAPEDMPAPGDGRARKRIHLRKILPRFLGRQPAAMEDHVRETHLSSMNDIR
jgi:hypothetical protein